MNTNTNISLLLLLQTFSFRYIDSVTSIKPIDAVAQVIQTPTTGTIGIFSRAKIDPSTSLGFTAEHQDATTHRPNHNRINYNVIHRNDS